MRAVESSYLVLIRREASASRLEAELCYISVFTPICDSHSSCSSISSMFVLLNVLCFTGLSGSRA